MLSTKNDVYIEQTNNEPNIYRRINTLLGHQVSVRAPRNKMEAIRIWGQLLTHLKEQGNQKDANQLLLFIEMIIGTLLDQMEKGDQQYNEFIKSIIEQIYDQPDLIGLIYGAIFSIIKKEQEGKVTFDQVYEIYKHNKNEFDNCKNYTCKIWPLQFEDANSEEVKTFKALAAEQNIQEIVKRYGAGIDAAMNIYDSLRGSDIGQEVYNVLKNLKVGEICTEPIVIKGAHNTSGIVFVQLLDVQKLDINPKAQTPNITAAVADRNIAEYIREIREKYFNAETLKQALSEEERAATKKAPKKKDVNVAANAPAQKKEPQPQPRRNRG